MSATATVLFDRPQQEIASILVDRLTKSLSTSIVTGFATPGGLEALAGPIKTRPSSIRSIVLGGATYPGFETLDELNAAGVSLSRLYVHLGHTRPSGFRKKPTVRFHPMLHSKVYFMELPEGRACAFVGSHNMTSFALRGLNGEAGVLIEGHSTDPEFDRIRQHILEAQRQSVSYSPDMKESLAWWTREFIDGLRSEIKLPVEWSIVRTILIFAKANANDSLRIGDEIYFELPAGIEQIDSLSTETHLFLFDAPPSDPWEALRRAYSAERRYTCTTLGAENKQGNREVTADWRIEGHAPPTLFKVPKRMLRPLTSAGMQQVRAEVVDSDITPYEYMFDRQKKEWEPVYDGRDAKVISNVGRRTALSLKDSDPDDPTPRAGWTLVKGLRSREQVPQERDAKALLLAVPDSGRMILVSLRRRKRLPDTGEENER